MPVRLDVSSGRTFFMQKNYGIPLQVCKKCLPLHHQNGPVA